MNESRNIFERNWITSTMAIVFDWLIIGIVIGLSTHYKNIALYIFSVFIIGARQHALGILLHDGVHGLLHKNKLINDFISDWFLAFPIFFTLEGYRREHLAHHRATQTDSDPDFIRTRDLPEYQFPQSRGRFFFNIFKYLIGLKTIREFHTIQVKTQIGTNISWGSQVDRLIFWLITALLITHFGVWREFFLYWTIPMSTYTMAVQYVRYVAEHCFVSNGDTRTIITGFLERFFIVPWNVGYHADHHLYPAVPFYNLKLLNKALLFKGTNIHITNRYFGELLKELDGTKK